MGAMLSLKNHVAVITGASSGIGRAIAVALGAEGATLCLVGRKPEVLNSVAQIARTTSARVACLI
jgi:NADP-dependent 3-hydroxy acid dehydrogenase YdfG